MKLLLDTCVWGGTAKILSEAGHEVRWMGELEPDPGDAVVLELAHAEDRILITLDKDFGELAIVYGKPHCGIIRLADLPGRQQASYCLNVLERFASELSQGAILTVTSDRVRVRTSD